jgi:hypothetical protein
MLVVTRKTFPAKEITCELTSAAEIKEAEIVLRKFYFDEFKNVDPHLLPRIKGRDEKTIKEQTELAFIDYFNTHVGDGLHVKPSERTAIYEALSNRVAEMEDAI